MSHHAEESMFGTGLPNRLINIAVPVNFFHLERAFGNPFPIIAPGAFNPPASIGLVGAVPTVLLVEGEGAAAGLGLVDTVTEDCPDTEVIQVEALMGWFAEGGRRDAWFANVMAG